MAKDESKKPSFGVRYIYVERQLDGVPVTGLYFAPQGKNILAICADCGFRETLPKFPVTSDIIMMNRRHLERSNRLVCTRGSVNVVY